jgi:hypothetical protein
MKATVQYYGGYLSWIVHQPRRVIDDKMWDGSGRTQATLSVYSTTNDVAQDQERTECNYRATLPMISEAWNGLLLTTPPTAPYSSHLGVRTSCVSGVLFKKTASELVSFELVL